MEKELITKLVETLQSASEHLEYCGYGDRWERECAQATNLEDRIMEALEAGKKYMEDHRDPVA